MAVNMAFTPLLFLSTPSARRATFVHGYLHRVRYDFYPRPPRGGRRICLMPSSGANGISIHALREEGDAPPAFVGFLAGISIHALREEGDIPAGGPAVAPQNFYPRPPRGGRPTLIRFWTTRSRYFYPRPPRGGRPRPRPQECHADQISIHALREEGDPFS